MKRQSGTSKQQDRQFTANAPACGICAWRFRFIEWGGFAIAALIYGVAFYCFEGTLRQHVSKRGSALLLFVPTVPIIIAWMTVFRPPLSVSGTETDIQYTFTSEAFKDDFLSMNQIAEVPIDKIAQPDEDDPFKAMQL